MPAVSRSVRPYIIGFLFLLTLSACAVRLVGLDHLLVWHDEVFTLVRVLGYSQSEIEQTIFSGELLNANQLLRFQTPDPKLGWRDALRAFIGHPEHAPLYYALGRLTTSLPFSPLVSLRGLSAVFGILLIPATYWLMRELFGRGLIPWVSATLVAFSPLQYLYAQEARQYALWTLLVVAASAALQRALRRDDVINWGVYGTLVTLGLYSHLLFVLLIPVHAVYGYLASQSNNAPFLPKARRWGMVTSAALIAFIPWLLVILVNLVDFGRHTAWMKIPIGLEQIAVSWGQHLVRMFLDLSPEKVGGGWVLLLPIVWALTHFMRRAPGPAAWMLILIALVYMATVLAPDLLFDGSRSLHVRYALPGVLALQLMVAWVIASAIEGKEARTRLMGRSAMALSVVLGAFSLVAIQYSNTWWNKQYSANNGEVARILNAGHRPLVVASDIGITSGELISLAYFLDDRARIWGAPDKKATNLPTGFGETLALTPWPLLKPYLEENYDLVTVAGTWHWFRVMPQASSDFVTSSSNEDGESQ
jgi:uncharacterized membrane protein